MAAFSLTASSDDGSTGGELQLVEDIVIARHFRMHSKILAEDRDLLIYLPETYDNNQVPKLRYPVIYLLDGAAYFEATTGIVHHLSAPNAAVQRIPESIVVAVQNTKRRRDMTPSHMSSGPYSVGSGGATFFRAFLEKELLPQVDAHFRTDKSAILVGHSLAGLFVLDTFVEQPHLFRAYIATDPSLWWDDNLLARKLAESKPPKAESRVRVFIAQANSPTGNNDEMDAAHRAGIAQFRKTLGDSQLMALDFYRYYGDETHLSVPLVAIYAGLLAVYGDYEKR
jgi:predicted alpha/beta superfamily hydrolase